MAIPSKSWIFTLTNSTSSLDEAFKLMVLPVRVFTNTPNLEQDDVTTQLPRQKCSKMTHPVLPSHLLSLPVYPAGVLYELKPYFLGVLLLANPSARGAT